MVDLVRIRKKVKEKLEKLSEEKSAASEEAANAAGGGPLPPPAQGAGEDTGAPRAAREDTGAPRAAREDTGAARAAGEDTAAPRIAAFLESAGQRQIVQEQAPTSASNETEVLTFVIAGELYAVDIEKIAEIVTPRPVTRVPNAAASIVGIFSLRGTIVTLIDVRGRLGHAPANDSNPDARVVVTRLDEENVGFLIDRVLRVVKIDPSSIKPQPVVHASEQDESVRGVFRHSGALTILLDLDKLLNGV